MVGFGLLATLGSVGCAFGDFTARADTLGSILIAMAFGWRSLVGRLRGSNDLTRPVSFVLLEKKYQPLSDELLLEHAHSAYDETRPVGGIEILKKRAANSRVLRVENFFFSFHQAQQRYTCLTPTYSKVIQRAWDDHTCWSSLDWASPQPEEKDKPGARRILLPLIGLLWSSNTAGLFFPDHGSTIPNVGDFPASIRWAGRNGVKLGELFPPPASTKPA